MTRMDGSPRRDDRGPGGAPTGPVTSNPTAGRGPMGSSQLALASTWLRASRLGLVVMALVVGFVAGLGAIAFRWLIFSFTWLATGHQEFGQQGRIGSLHLPWLGTGFLVVIPVIGGLLYGPLIQRFAREARGHGVPEVMVAVAENGGRIRPPVTIVKALASAICIGVGGSVGREGPIVQIGSAFASTMGQLVRMSETRLRILVACGAAGGISATFNAPVTGLFFGFEIILREFSIDALFATILSAVMADIVSQAAFGAGPFFSDIPHHLVLVHDYNYLLIAVLGVLCGLVGVGFKTFLYRAEDLLDELWKGRPEWARPAVGGVGLGLLLLALPQMYGVGYPVMDQIIGGREALWFLIVLMLGKIVASSLTLSIGGSGGVFAPSLFTGAAAGMAFGVIVHHMFGADAGTLAIYPVVAMGGVFGGAAQAPLTAIASVVEMTGNFGLTLPVMLTVGVAVAVSKRLTYGSIYTTKLLRRGIDIERPKPTSVLQMLTVADVMQPVPQIDRDLSAPKVILAGESHEEPTAMPDDQWAALIGPVTDSRQIQALFSDEQLEQALRQLVLYGRSGLPVLSEDGKRLKGWITRQNVLRAIAESVSSSRQEAEKGTAVAEFALEGSDERVHDPTLPLNGYGMVEITMRPGAPALGHRLGDIAWPPGSIVVAVTERRELIPPRDDVELRSGERVILLAPLMDPGGDPPDRDRPPGD